MPRQVVVAQVMFACVVVAQVMFAQVMLAQVQATEIGVKTYDTTSSV